MTDFTVTAWSFCDTEATIIANSDPAKAASAGAVSFTVRLSALPEVIDRLASKGLTVSVEGK